MDTHPHSMLSNTKPSTPDGYPTSPNDPVSDGNRDACPPLSPPPAYTELEEPRPSSSPPAGTVGPTKTLHVYHSPSGEWERAHIIKNADRSGVEYNVSYHHRCSLFSSSSGSGAANILVHRLGAVVGSVVLHSFSTKIHCSTAERDGLQRQFVLKRAAAVSTSFRMDLGRMGGAVLWKGTTKDASLWSWGSLKLVEEGTGRILASFVNSRHKSVKKVGRFELWGEKTEDPEWVTAVVTAGLGLLEWDRRLGV